MDSDMVLKIIAVANGIVWSVALGTQLDYIPGAAICVGMMYVSAMAYRKVAADEVDA